MMVSWGKSSPVRRWGTGLLATIVATIVRGAAAAQLRYDHHVHLLSPRLFRDWGSLGITFSRPAEDYSDPARVLANVKAQRAIAVSMAHLYASEWFAELPEIGEHEQAWVAAENDFIAAAVRTAPDRLIGFYSVNPRQPYAREELDRCRQIDGLAGLKLHLPACGVDLMHREHYAALAQTIGWCADHSVPILVHPFSGEEPLAAVERFWSLFEPYPQLQLIVAHVGSSGGFNDRSAALLAGFQRRREQNPEFGKAMFFDLSGAILLEETDGIPATTPERVRQLANAMRELGLQHFLHASDYPVFSVETGERILREKLQLTPQEIQQLGDQHAPVLAPTDPGR